MATTANINCLQKCVFRDTQRFSKISNSKILEFISKSNIKSGKIANGAEYRMDAQFQSLLIVEISIIFQIKKKFNSKNI